MLVKLHISRLKANAGQRPEGYVDFVLSRGKIVGEHVELDVAALNEVYKKFPEPVVVRPPPPSAAKMSVNFTSAMAGWAKSGFKRVGKKVYESRLAICLACDHWDAGAWAGVGRCDICGCTKGKLWLATSHCPLKEPKW